jgi:hypothetical protein
VRLFRDVLDVAAPRVVLVTERNVARSENLSDFGPSRDEAQLVSDFALPPLVLLASSQTLELGLGPCEVLWLTPSGELEKRIESATERA